MASVWFRIIATLFLVFVVKSTPELVVNVRSKSGSITQQEFESFPDKDLVAVSYKLIDYRFVDILLDFNKKVQIFKTIVLGEIDLAENPYETICFAIPLLDNEFISPDVMSKLRQKNPSTVRIPEMDLGTQEIVLDHSVQISQARFMNENIRKLCGDIDVVHVSGEDLQSLFVDGNFSKAVDQENAIRNLTATLRTKKRCNSVSESNKPCICRLPLCLSWYPCDVKYCQKESDDGSKQEEFRCGIKTCGKCRDFDYLVSGKGHCFWDDRLKS